MRRILATLSVLFMVSCGRSDLSDVKSSDVKEQNRAVSGVQPHDNTLWPYVSQEACDQRKTMSVGPAESDGMTVLWKWKDEVMYCLLRYIWDQMEWLYTDGQQYAHYRSFWEQTNLVDYITKGGDCSKYVVVPEDDRPDFPFIIIFHF